MRLLPTAVLAWIVLGAIGTLAASLAVRSVTRGEYLSSVVALGASAFCYGLVLPLVKVVRGNVRSRGQVDDGGTTFRPDRGIDIPVQLSLLGLVVACALIMVLVPLERLDIPVPPAMRFSLPLVSAAIVAAGTPMLWRNVLRGSSKYLRLTPTVFEIAQGWRPQSGEWEQVEDVADETPGASAPTPGTIVMVMADGSAPTMAAASYTPEGTALRKLVRFYWQHAEYRDELTDGRAIVRLAEFEGKP